MLDVMKKYLEEVVKYVAMGSPQTFPLDRGVKLMLPPDDIANALVQGGYYADLKQAKSRVMRHLRSDTAEKRAQR